MCQSERTFNCETKIIIMYDIDVDRLINAIKIRPALYCTVSGNDKICPTPSHRKHKEKLWNEIAEELHDDWNHMSQLHKIQFVREVQKRWKSLRTCFTRELCMQKREQSKRDANIVVKRRKRYEYFDKLNFLQDQYDKSEIIYSDAENSRDPLDHFITEHVSLEFGEEFENKIPLKKEVDTENYESRHAFYERSIGVKERVLDTLKDLRKDEADDDRQFVLSLIPIFKKMSLKTKLQARIDVLKVLQNKLSDVNIKVELT